MREKGTHWSKKMSQKKNITKEEIIAAIRACTKKLGFVPGLRELENLTNVMRHDIITLFGNYAAVLKVCKLRKTGTGMKAETKDLLLDWVRVVRKQKRIPRFYEYRQDGLYSDVPFRSRFGTWSNMPKAVKRYAVENGLTREWRDVIALIDGRPKNQPGTRNERPLPVSKVRAGRPTYGPLIRPFPMLCAPTNEFGVIFLFGALAEGLGFQVLRIQGQYPDGEALRLVAENRLQRVKLEFELQSRNFLYHNHDASKCDLIVCWENNWPDAPVEVIELKTVVSDQQPAKEPRRRFPADE
jgi:hypothetical protein